MSTVLYIINIFLNEKRDWQIKIELVTESKTMLHKYSVCLLFYFVEESLPLALRVFSLKVIYSTVIWVHMFY